MEHVRAVLLIFGRVQGVFFRESTRMMAQELGLSGYVRNLPLRRVEAVFEGPADLVEQAIAWCRKGPPSATVSEVKINRPSPTGEFQGFTVRY